MRFSSRVLTASNRLWINYTQVRWTLILVKSIGHASNYLLNFDGKNRWTAWNHKEVRSRGSQVTKRQLYGCIGYRSTLQVPSRAGFHSLSLLVHYHSTCAQSQDQRSYTSFLYDLAKNWTFLWIFQAWKMHRGRYSSLSRRNEAWYLAASSLYASLPKSWLHWDLTWSASRSV